MKIRIIKYEELIQPKPTMTIQELADKYDLLLEVEEYEKGKYKAWFHNTAVEAQQWKLQLNFSSDALTGYAVDEAIEKFAKNLSNNRLCINKTGEVIEVGELTYAPNINDEKFHGLKLIWNS